MAGKIVQSVNTIPTTQKQEMYHQTYQQFQPQAQYIPVQFIQKPVYVPQQHQPAAMIIVAQPAVVPQHMLYNGGVQQLLNYFHSNPQARYQLLHGFQQQQQGYQPQPHGYQPQPTAQTYFTQNPSASATIGNYQFVAAPPQNQILSSPIHTAYNQVQQHVQQQPQVPIQPMQLSQISNLAHFNAQQYTQQYSPPPIRSIPPIITGLENFTPEQQAAIKAQLNSHLGAPSTLNQLNTNTIAPTAQTHAGAVLPTPQSTILTSTQGQPSNSNQISNLSQLSSKYSAQVQQNSNDFMPTKEDKSETDSSTNYTPPLTYRGQFTKG